MNCCKSYELWVENTQPSKLKRIFGWSDIQFELLNQRPDGKMIKAVVDEMNVLSKYNIELVKQSINFKVKPKTFIK